MTGAEYEKLKADVRGAPGWRPHGDPNCTDCLGMSHCETHFKIDGTYPDEATQTGCPDAEKP
jgi:hypothetical protein